MILIVVCVAVAVVQGQVCTPTKVAIPRVGNVVPGRTHVAATTLGSDEQWWVEYATGTSGRAPHLRLVVGMRVSPDGLRLLSWLNDTPGGPISLVLSDLQGLNPILVASVRTVPLDVAWSSDSDQFVFVDQDRGVFLQSVSALLISPSAPLRLLSASSVPVGSVWANPSFSLNRAFVSFFQTVAGSTSLFATALDQSSPAVNLSGSLQVLPEAGVVWSPVQDAVTRGCFAASIGLHCVVVADGSQLFLWENSTSAGTCSLVSWSPTASSLLITCGKPVPSVFVFDPKNPAMSPVKLNSDEEIVTNPVVFLDDSSLVVYRANFNGTGTLFVVDAGDPEMTRIVLTPPEIIGRPGVAGHIVVFLQDYVAYGLKATPSSPLECYFTPLRGPLRPQTRLSPVGDELFYMQRVDGQRMFMSTRSYTYLVTFPPGGGAPLVETISLPNQSANSLYLQQNKVSAVYLDGNSFYTACLAAPLNLTNASDLSVGPKPQGHVFVGANVNVIVSGQAVTIPGTAVVASSSTLTLENHCVAGTFTVYNSTWTEGSFGSISVVCPSGCQAQASPISTPQSLSLTIMVACSDSLSTAALVGIIVGSVVGATICVFAIVAATRFFSFKYTQRSNAMIRGESLPNHRSDTPLTDFRSMNE